MPDKLFFNTPISVSLWFVSKDRHGNGHRRREGEVLFIDARKLGSMVNRRLRELTQDDIQRIADAYHDWRNHGTAHEDIAGFSRAASLHEISERDFVLNPGLYVGNAESAANDEPIDEKIARLTSELLAEFSRGDELANDVRRKLEALDR